MTSIICTRRLLKLIYKKNQSSWCKYRCLHTSSFISKSLKNRKIPVNSSSNDAEPVIIQPNINAAVKSTLNSHLFTQLTLEVPRYLTKLLPTEYHDIGQPTPFTHPHLFQSDDEVTPGIRKHEYISRRRNLMRILSDSRLGIDHDKHVVILPAANLKIMTNDIPYPFHQDTDFLYLTGLNEPEAILTIEYQKKSNSMKFLLFVKPKDPKRELWDGAVVEENAAVEYFNADKAFPLSSFHSIIREHYGDGTYCVWYRKINQTSQTISSLLNSPLFSNKALHDIGYNLQMLRLIKSSSEINIMKHSTSIASKAFTKVMQNTQPGLPESHLHALLTYECHINGAQHLSFPPVVAGGNRANTLHYVNNTQILRAGDLVLMDGGCEYNGYASDLTRTFPVSGKFSSSQRELYEIVLRVQITCLEACKPGVSMDHLHHLMLVNLGRELQNINFIPKNVPEIQLKRNAAEFCPHHLGHYLGMDTHDTPLLHRGLPLQVGMVFTLEPGIYVPENNSSIPKRYRGIGIRIEDDVMMTENGPYVLSAELPKEVNDIETLMRRDN